MSSTGHLPPSAVGSPCPPLAGEPPLMANSGQLSPVVPLPLSLSNLPLPGTRPPLAAVVTAVVVASSAPSVRLSSSSPPCRCVAAVLPLYHVDGRCRQPSGSVRRCLAVGTAGRRPLRPSRPIYPLADRGCPRPCYVAAMSVSRQSHVYATWYTRPSPMDLVHHGPNRLVSLTGGTRRSAPVLSPR